jgi:hypothetical protein
MKNDNYFLTVENFLTDDECNSIIDKYKFDYSDGETDYVGYKKVDLKFDDITVFPILKKLKPVVDYYKMKYSEINYVGSFWKFTHLRLKKFEANKNYNIWHSEHSLTNPHRILNLLIYLTDHNCGTKFFNNTTIKSKSGRLVLFPSYFTHTHKGEKCPDNKIRYILSGYFNFFKKDNNV